MTGFASCRPSGSARRPHRAARGRGCPVPALENRRNQGPCEGLGCRLAAYAEPAQAHGRAGRDDGREVANRGHRVVAEAIAGRALERPRKGSRGAWRSPSQDRAKQARLRRRLAHPRSAGAVRSDPVKASKVRSGSGSVTRAGPHWRLGHQCLRLASSAATCSAFSASAYPWSPIARSCSARSRIG